MAVIGWDLQNSSVMDRLILDGVDCRLGKCTLYLPLLVKSRILVLATQAIRLLMLRLQAKNVLLCILLLLLLLMLLLMLVVRQSSP